MKYLDNNNFDDVYQYVDDGVFGGLAAGKPSIFPIYWSRPQMEARGDDNMATTRQFLNSFWKHESEGRSGSTPTATPPIPDRVRRREPGTSSGGLSPHTDSGSVERWLLPAPTTTSSGMSSPATRRHTTRGTAPTGPRSTSSSPP